MSKLTLRRSIIAVGMFLTAALAYLCLWPVPADPKAWSGPVPPGFPCAYAPNTRLADLQRIDIGDEFGPEHLAIGPDGKLYAAMTSGNVVRMDPDGGSRQVFASTGGRVLGFDFDSAGTMIAADAMKGLLAIDREGQVRVLTDRVSTGDPIRYANSIVVAPDGAIYFTDASARFAPKEWGGTYEASVLDILEQAATGRVLVHDPATARTQIVAHGFSFANGIALSLDGQSLFVAETGRYRIWKLDRHARDIDAQNSSPHVRVLIDNLPGYPDNLMRGREGRIWVGLFRPRNPAADSLSQRPFVRTILLRLPRSWLPVGEPYGHVFAMDENGRVVEDLQDPAGAYPETTGATETADRLYIHSLHEPSIGWTTPPRSDSALSAREEIYVLRSIREPHAPAVGWCGREKTGFEPFPSDAERVFSFWSIRSRSEDGRVVDAKQAQVADLHACFGATDERARQNFYAEGRLGTVGFRGRGECLALAIDFPQKGLFPVRCQLILDGLPAPFVGGLLTTSTMTSSAPLGGDTDPAGYTQASIATIRLWKAQ